MKPFHERNPVMLAIVGTVAILVMLTVAFNARRLPFIGNGPTYYADFTNASGLVSGEEVRIAGIKVGQVSSVSIVAAHVRVAFNVKGASFGPDTSASIEIRSLLGEHYLALDPAGSGQMQVGAEIPMQRTSTPFNVVPAFSKLSTTVGHINTGQLAASFTTIAKSFGHTSPQVRQTLRGLSRLSETISSRDSQIHSLIAHTSNVTGAVASRDTQITQLIDASNQVLTVLDQRRKEIHQLLAGASGLAQQLTGLVHDNAKQLGPALARLHEVVALLHRDDKQLGETLDEAGPFARLFTNVVGTGRWFDSTIKVPNGLAACDSTPDDPASSVLDPILSALNKLENGASTACLPLGPAPGGTK
jgi:phospholipid/cholesterol/gamma-HCH transport system substrate-binding protein